MAIRGSNMVQSSSTSGLNVPLPSGTLAGDLAIIYFGGAFGGTTPSGWTSLYNSGGGFTLSMMSAYKILASADITAGQIFVGMGGSGDINVSIFVFVGGTSGVREYQTGGPAYGSSQTVTNTTSSAVLNTDVGVYWACAQQGGSVVSITPASGSATIVQSFSSNPVTQLGWQQMPGGALSVANFATLAGGGLWAQQVIVEGAGTPTGVFLINPGTDGGMRPQLKGGVNG